MTRNNLLELCAVTVLIGLFALPAPSDARPKKIVSNGCTMDQIQSNFGNSCVSQMEQDILSGKPYTHALLCSGGQMLCCTYDNTTNQIQTCRRPAGSGLMSGAMGNVGISGTAGIQRRGVDASTEAADEEAPAPEWMTPERLQQLQQDVKAKRQ